ncbi:wax ester synthase/diacylglycerol acyltransferase 5-like [Lotus japonicus]|uniref:wax ester synthase/diacylglycerol acyltransferase 5-like n=1 Tax=Lotus japonicus TaxID=34305 RepID=UPI002584F28A|nr:wax ester synthase/diacylglycerol acyltransferase 5-like [Lotus japonicus]XP_057435973.1 wax ester synthase/diacylglycerol acyltransferase 5-like [Lotus japonicus]XP_057435974.1 wax ester synthase/diacylglycerol acyltransferase 5-like [Lotus japonicus]XP_057435975.1 wax ester synthase/diacylglycerol acyltransferase 5-like [Lotus japonicus]XP_057435976.1 wax ester synthase/diacylglycerol acyltransferase 5-like [Lotus japonicus]XP_057435977.1 wax ester synthase/diacylglycerol acyltransferase 
MELEEQITEPVSPVGQYFNSSVLRIYIIGILEFEVPIHDLQTMSLLQHVFLPINPRFSSIMVQGKNGEKRWKQVEVNLKDHVKTPIFPEGKTVEYYDKLFLDYLSTISVEQLPQERPLWQIHMINYPTNNASGTVIFKLHHALGDGYSLMGALLSCLQRVDDPSLPLSFPSLKPSKTESLSKRRFSWMLSSAFNTASDFAWSVVKSSILNDDKTPIRAGDEGSDFQPISISNLAFSIDQIKDIKSKLGVTVNDVVTGIVLYGTRLYMQDMDSKSKTSNSTALVLLNTRNIEGYQSIGDMLNTKTGGPWGNKISFLHVPIPKLSETRISNPLEFIRETHNIIKRKKQSLAVALTGTLLDIEGKFRGQEKVAKHLRGTLTKSSAVISTLVGPVQQMSLANHPVKGLYFTLAGGPESLVISMMSYMGVIRVTLKTEKDFIDEQKLKSCIQGAFETILKATREIPVETK